MSNVNISHDSVLWMIVGIPDAEVKDALIRFIASKLGNDTGVNLDDPDLLYYYDIHQGQFDEAAEHISDDDPKRIVDIINQIMDDDLYLACHSIIIE